MIYTSYFGNKNNFPEGACVIGITKFPPSGLQENWDALAPSSELLMQYKNKEIDEFVFKVKFLEQLEKEILQLLFHRILLFLVGKNKNNIDKITFSK